MLEILLKHKMLLAVVFLMAALGITSMMYKLQKAKNYSQKIIIEKLEYENKTYSDTLKKAIEDQKRADEAMLSMASEHKQINDEINHYEKLTGEEFKKQTWDDEKIPDNIVCLLTCVQQSKPVNDCPCPNAKNPSKLLRRV